MGDLMRPVKFSALLQRVFSEYKEKQSIFNVTNILKIDSDKTLKIFGHKLENPLGIAAGPHTQLAQNIVSDYVAGARFIELKTVQVLEGEELGIQKPCIRCDDEAYNVEWSSELKVSEAMDEYIKAWIACKVIAKELRLGDSDAFVFNMSCGYTLEGISSPKIDAFIEGLKDASKTAVWKECIEYLHSSVASYTHVDKKFIDSITPHVCNSITISTLHGCPAAQIESIVSYLITKKGLNTYIKCNPTMLGADYIRKILDDMGYDYVKFNTAQFEKDLKLTDAVLMIQHLQATAKAAGLVFGVKLTNTFQVEVLHQELPGKAMYMSGKALYPLTIGVAALLSKEFGSTLPMSFSGGADKNNIEAIFNAGIWPVTVCTVLLRPNGYDNIKVLAEKLSAQAYPSAQKPDKEKIAELSKNVRTDKNYCKSPQARKKVEAHRSYEGQHSENIFCKALCKSCVKVCPNRANEILQFKDTSIILHIDSYCNECGNCQFACVEPCLPYRDRLTFFENKTDLNNSRNPGFSVAGDNFTYRWQGKTADCAYSALPEQLKQIYDAIKTQKSFLFY